MSTPLLFHWGHDPRALREMLARTPYTHLIRAPDDPARQLRGRGPRPRAPHHLELNKLDVEQLRAELLKSEGEGPTFVTRRDGEIIALASFDPRQILGEGEESSFKG